MKKTFALLLFLLLCLLSGCGGTPPVSVEDYSWKLTSVQGPPSGDMIGGNQPYSESFPQAELLDVSCQAEDGRLTLSDLTTGKNAQGSFRLVQTSPDSAIYEITFPGEIQLGRRVLIPEAGSSQAPGHGVSAMTTYNDGSQTPTFIISLGNYVLNFQASSSGEE